MRRMTKNRTDISPETGAQNDSEKSLDELDQRIVALADRRSAALMTTDPDDAAFDRGVRALRLLMGAAEIAGGVIDNGDGEHRRGGEDGSARGQWKLMIVFIIRHLIIPQNRNGEAMRKTNAPFRKWPHRPAVRLTPLNETGAAMCAAPKRKNAARNPSGEQDLLEMCVIHGLHVRRRPSPGQRRTTGPAPHSRRSGGEHAPYLDRHFGLLAHAISFENNGAKNMTAVISGIAQKGTGGDGSSACGGNRRAPARFQRRSATISPPKLTLNSSFRAKITYLLRADASAMAGASAFGVLTGT